MCFKLFVLCSRYCSFKMLLHHFPVTDRVVWSWRFSASRKFVKGQQRFHVRLSPSTWREELLCRPRLRVTYMRSIEWTTAHTCCTVFLLLPKYKTTALLKQRWVSASFFVLNTSLFRARYRQTCDAFPFKHRICNVPVLLSLKINITFACDEWYFKNRYFIFSVS